MNRDITERKNAEQALQDSEKQYRALFEQAADSILLIEPNTAEFVDFNDVAHESLGYTREEFGEMKITDFARLDSQEVHSLIQETLDKGSLVFEANHETKSGELRTRLISAKVVSLQGKVLIQSMWTDITDRKRAETQLAATIDMLEEALRFARQNAEIAQALGDSAAAINSTLDLEKVLDRILVDVSRVVPNQAADIMLLHETDGVGTELQIVESRGYDDIGSKAEVHDLQLQLNDMPYFVEMVKIGRPIAISDTQADETWVEFAENAWIRSWAGAPMRVERNTIGFLNVNSDKAGFFTQDEAEILLAFADQAAAAIQNARLYSQAQQEIAERARAEKEIQKRSEDLALLNSVSDAINRHDSLPKIINFIADETKQAFSGYGITVSLLGDDKTQLHLQNLALPSPIIGRIAKLTNSSPSQMRLMSDGSKIHRAVLQECKSMLVYDPAALEAYIDEIAKSAWWPSEKGRKVFVRLIPKLFMSLGIKSVMLSPLIFEDEAIGVIELASKRRLTVEDLSRFEAIAAQLTIAIRRKQALRESELKYRNLSEQLEEKVGERTQELEVANKELESFSYSVSHDLRAPLRAMDGFSRILMKDYSSELSDEGQGYLKRVSDNAKQMGQLVDDLLAFSRLGRAEMRKQPFAPDELARQVLTELTATGKNGHAKVSIGELPECYGDPSLLKQVYANLLSNALKFTSKRTDAEIEVGFEQFDAEDVYFVKDNGAGFDMAYADKLFGVFQRLHSPEDYEGTGVGLAIVNRVVERHGGRVWAEAEVEKGATFFFTLDNEGRDD